MEQLTRTKTITMMGVTFGDWYRDGVLFQLANIPQTPAWPGAKGGWRDAVPIDQLYLVYRWETKRPLDGRVVSQVHLRHCDVSFCLYSEQQKTNFGWSDTNLYQVAGRIFTGHQLQPNVAAQVGSSNVAVTLYQQLSAGFTNLQDVYGNPLPDSPPDYHLSILGVVSTNAFASFVGPFNLRETEAPWLPCAAGNGYWGDYVGSALLQTAPLSTAFGPLPYTVTAHADSTGGCTFVGANGRNVFDQHVQAVVW